MRGNMNKNQQSLNSMLKAMLAKQPSEFKTWDHKKICEYKIALQAGNNALTQNDDKKRLAIKKLNVFFAGLFL